jgi:hypothetical protein
VMALVVFGFSLSLLWTGFLVFVLFKLFENTF